MSAFPGVSSYQSSSLGSKFVVIGVVCCQEMRRNALFHKVLPVLTKYLLEVLNMAYCFVSKKIQFFSKDLVFLPEYRMYCRKYMRLQEKEWDYFRLTLKTENGIVLASHSERGLRDG